jgi:hypothetical protein
MLDLSRLLPKLLRVNGGNPELAVKLAWNRAAGSGLRQHAVPLRLDEKTLTVAVADAIWQKQLEHMRAELIYRTNNLLGKGMVESLVFRIEPGAVRTRQDAAPPRATAGHESPPEELLFAAGTISDEDLRARFMRAAQNCISRREARDVKT